MILNIEDKSYKLLKEYDIDIDVGSFPNYNNYYNYDNFAVNDWFPVNMYTVSTVMTLFGSTVCNGFWCKRKPVKFKGDHVFKDTIYIDKNLTKIPNELFKYHYVFYVTPMISASQMWYSTTNGKDIGISAYLKNKKYKNYFDTRNYTSLAQILPTILTFGLNELTKLIGTNPPTDLANPFYLCDAWYFIASTNIGTRNEMLGKALLYGEKLYNFIQAFRALKGLAEASIDFANAVAAGSALKQADTLVDLSKISFEKGVDPFKNLDLDFLMPNVMSYVDGISKYFIPERMIYCQDVDGGYAYECIVDTNKVPLTYMNIEDLGFTPELNSFINEVYADMEADNKENTYDFFNQLLCNLSSSGSFTGKLELEVGLQSLLTGDQNLLIKPFKDYFVGRYNQAYFIQVGVEVDNG